MRLAAFFSFLVLVVSLSPARSAATPSFSGSVSACGVAVGSVASGPSTVFLEGTRTRPTQLPESGVGSCTGYGAARADAQSIGASSSLTSDRNTGRSSAAARSIVDDFVLETALGGPSVATVTFRFLIHAAYVPSAVNTNGSNYLAQARAQIAADASIVQRTTTNTTPFFLREEVFDEATLNTVPTLRTFEVVSGPVSLFVGQSFTIVLSLRTEATVTMGSLGSPLASVASGTLGGRVDVDALNSFGLANDGGAFVTFDQPGVFLASQSAGISGSQWNVPEPAFASLLLVAALGLAAIRGRAD